MTLKYANRVHEACSGSGVSSLTLLGAVSGKATFTSKIETGSLVPYVLLDGNGIDWEVGIGTLASASELQRTTVKDSSASSGRINSETAGTPTKISLTTNQHEVFIAPFDKSIFSKDENGALADPTPIRAALFVDTIAQMTALDGLSAGETVFVKGDAALGDALGACFRWDAADAGAGSPPESYEHDVTATGLFKKVRFDIQGLVRSGDFEVDAKTADTTGASLYAFFRKKATAATAWARWHAFYASAEAAFKLGIRHLQSSAEKFFVSAVSVGDNFDRVELLEPTVLPTRTNANGLKTRALSWLSGVSRLVMARTDAAGTGSAADYYELALTKGGYYVAVSETATDLRAIDAAAVFLDGDKARLLGLSAIGDVVAFDVEWSAASSATADNVNVFRPSTGAAASGNGRWLRVTATPFALRSAATKAALKAMPASSVDTVRVLGRATAGDGGGGEFRWSSSDHSADVTADTLEGFYVAPTGGDGSTGAWVRVDKSGFLRPEWFGGYGDDSTDCAAAFAALDVMADRLDRRTIFWLGEIYRFNGTVTQTKSGIQHVGSNTYWRFNHTNDGLQIGTNSAFCDAPRIDGIHYLQASGSGYAINYYNGRELSLANFEDSSVRNFLRAGAQYVAITGIANNGSGLARITCASDAYATGDSMYVNLAGTGVTLTAGGAAAGRFTLTRISSGVYDLVDSVFGGSHASVNVSGAANNGSGLIRVTMASDAYVTGNLVYFDLSGTGVTGGVGAFLVNRISSGVYDLRGSTFGGSYTSGGTGRRAGRVAPFTYQLTIDMANPRNSVQVGADKALDIYGMAGALKFNGLPSFQCANTTAGVPNAGTRGVHWRGNTTAFDRFDHADGKAFFRGFERGLYIDNTRVVSVYMPYSLFDSVGAPIEVVTSAVDATLGGAQNIVLTGSRGGLDAGGNHHFAKIDCAGASVTNLILDGIEGDFEREAVILAGGANGVKLCRMDGAQLTMRPTSAYDAVSISGLVNAQIAKLQVFKQSGAGSIDDAIQIANDYSGALSIDDVQFEGGTGHCVEIATGGSISRTTAKITVRDLKNATTAANLLSDAGDIASAQAEPHSTGRRWTDIAAVTGATPIGAADGDYGDVTGTGASITNFGSGRTGAQRVIRWKGSNTIIHDGSRITLPVAKIQTEDGAVSVFRCISGVGSGHWELVSHRAAAGVLIGMSTGFTPVRMQGFTNTSNIGDDAAIALPAMQTNDFGEVRIVFADKEWVDLVFENFPNASIALKAKSGANVDVLANGVLSGTTGTDGRWSVAITDGGVLYIENRRGSSLNCRVAILGGGGV